MPNNPIIDGSMVSSGSRRAGVVKHMEFGDCHSQQTGRRGNGYVRVRREKKWDKLKRNQEWKGKVQNVGQVHVW